METRIDEIAARVYRLSTYVAPGAGLTFNQFLVDADEPLLFACGQRSLFASVSAATARVMSLDRLRWITFSHVESYECGALNDWLAAALSASDSSIPMTAPSTPTVTPLPARSPIIDVLKRPTTRPRSAGGARIWTMACAIEVNAMLKTPASIRSVTAAA